MIVTRQPGQGRHGYRAKRKVVVKRLNAIQNFGSMDVLCTDKTGTLTQDKIILEHHVDVTAGATIRMLGTGLAQQPSPERPEKSDGPGRGAIRQRNPTFRVPFAYSKVDELPFDFVRRRLSIIVKDSRDDHLMVCKGAVEEMLAHRQPRIHENGKVVGADATAIAKTMLAAWPTSTTQDGFRVLLVATREIPKASENQYSTADERELVIRGFLTFLDPPKETAGPAIAALRDMGVTVKVLTGDNDRGHLQDLP